MCASGSATGALWTEAGPELSLGGSLGGRPGGFGLGAGGAEVLPSAPSPSLLFGGGGRLVVDRPVVSIRNGTGGGFGFSSSAAGEWCMSSCASGAVWFVRVCS